MINKLDTDDIIQSYFNESNINVDHQISSYNYYIDTIIPQIISQYFPIRISFNDSKCMIKEVTVDIKNIRMGKPLLIENNGCSNQNNAFCSPS